MAPAKASAHVIRFTAARWNQTVRLAGVLLVVVLIHGVLVSLPALSGGVAPALASIAVQCLAVAAVMARRRRDPVDLRMPWLLLATAASLQVVWAGVNVLAAVLKDEGGYLTAIGVVCSALYMIPAMLLIARGHGRTSRPRRAHWTWSFRAWWA